MAKSRGRQLKGLFAGGSKVVSIEEMNAAIEQVGASAADYGLDDGPLSEEFVAALQKDVAKHMPRGKMLHCDHLFDVGTTKRS